MEKLIEELVKRIVDEPDAVRVTTVTDGPATVAELRVAPGDIGKVIGRHGRTVRALRKVLSASRRRRDVTLEIIET